MFLENETTRYNQQNGLYRNVSLYFGSFNPMTSEKYRDHSL